MNEFRAFEQHLENTAPVIKTCQGSCAGVDYTYVLKQVSNEYILKSYDMSNSLIDTIIWDINKIELNELIDMMERLELNKLTEND